MDIREGQVDEHASDLRGHGLSDVLHDEVEDDGTDLLLVLQVAFGQCGEDLLRLLEVHDLLLRLGRHHHAGLLLLLLREASLGLLGHSLHGALLLLVLSHGRRGASLAAHLRTGLLLIHLIVLIVPYLIVLANAHFLVFVEVDLERLV